MPGSHALLEDLRRRGVTLYLASGTDLKYVRREAELLGWPQYFGEHIYGALDDYQNFSKQMIIERILREDGLHGEELLGFGDGFVEIEEVQGRRRRGGGGGQRRGEPPRRQRLEARPPGAGRRRRRHPRVPRPRVAVAVAVRRVAGEPAA